MSINSRQKGKTGELELSHKLQEYGFNTHRTQQFCGANGNADIEGIEGLHIECKRVEQLNIDNALNQAINDKREGEIPVVMHRKNRTQWKATLLLDDFLEIYKALLTQLDHKKRTGK